MAEDSDTSYGSYVVIEHVINQQNVASLYAHMQRGSIRVKVGDHVNVAQVIGLVGSTGMSTGPHLHFEIHPGGVNGEPIDPLVWLRANTN